MLLRLLELHRFDRDGQADCRSTECRSMEQLHCDRVLANTHVFRIAQQVIQAVMQGTTVHRRLSHDMTDADKLSSKTRPHFDVEMPTVAPAYISATVWQ